MSDVEVTQETIDEARGQGWVPLEEFRDDEAKWVDANTFVKRGREINPILRKHNAELKKQIESLQRDSKEAIEAAKEFREFQKSNFETKKASLEAELAQLRQAKKEAINESDGDRVVAIDEAIDDLKEQKESLKAPVVKEQVQENEVDPTLQVWLDKNKWFGEDKSMTRRTNALGAVLREEFPNLKGQPFLDKLDEEVRKTYPDKFEREKPQQLEGNSSTRANSGGKKSYTDLPADAKQACDRFIKQGLYKANTVAESRAAYVADYFGEE